MTRTKHLKITRPNLRRANTSMLAEYASARGYIGVMVGEWDKNLERKMRVEGCNGSIINSDYWMEEKETGRVLKIFPLERCAYLYHTKTNGIIQCEVFLFDGGSYCREHETLLKERALRDNSTKIAAAASRQKVAKAVKKFLASMSEGEIAIMLEKYGVKSEEDK